MAAMWATGAETRQAMCCLIDPSDIADVGAMATKHPDTPVRPTHWYSNLLPVWAKSRAAHIKAFHARCVRHPGLKLNIPPQLFCISCWCPDFEFRGTL